MTTPIPVIAPTLAALLPAAGGQVQPSSPLGVFLQRVGEALPLHPPIEPILPVLFDSSSYGGDGIAPREFQIGFTPRILFIFSAMAIGIKIDSMPGDLIFIGQGMGNGVIITPTGFIISAAGNATLNVLGQTFYFFGAR